VIPHQQVLLKQNLTNHLTLPHNFISLCFNNCWLFVHRITEKSYLLSPIFVATSRSPQHILDHNRSIAAQWIVKTVGEVLPTLLRFGSRVERCSGGQRGRRGRAAAEASAASAAGADAQPAYPPAAASGPSCKGQGCKTESVMIVMNALIDLEYAAASGTVTVLMHKVCTQYRLLSNWSKKRWSLY
jgi:hypothetical protein